MKRLMVLMLAALIMGVAISASPVQANYADGGFRYLP